MSSKAFYTVPFVWSKTLWVTTFAVFALWIGLSVLFLYHIFVDEPATIALFELIVLNLIFLPMVLICEGLAPQRLEIGAEQIVILRRYNSIVLSREHIKSIERLPQSAMRGAIRTGGVGGFFGYFGNYYTKSLGSFKLFATNFRNLYHIKTWDGKSIVVSCDEPEIMEQFIEQ